MIIPLFINPTRSYLFCYILMASPTQCIYVSRNHRPSEKAEFVKLGCQHLTKKKLITALLSGQVDYEAPAAIVKRVSKSAKMVMAFK